MRRAIFGGSFDPVHKGHLSLAEHARRMARLDEVIFVPVGRPAHKSRIIASKSDRLNMLKAALKNKKYFSIDTYELRNGDPSYSYKTIKYFKRKYPKDELCFLIGADSLATLPKWKKGLKLLDLCKFIVGRRKSANKIDLPVKYKNKVIFFETPFVNISSSEIRENLKKAGKIKKYVPSLEADYIKRKKIYG